MTKVITYGTFDLFHYGHYRLLERAKQLGDYLIVGITSDNFDRNRGKINVKQSLIERINNVRETGLADEIIIEEYDGQKIDDIIKYNIDIFTVGSDWTGTFDYLKDYCKVVYLERTLGVSSSEIRSSIQPTKLGFVGESAVLSKYYNECSFVNGIEVSACHSQIENNTSFYNKDVCFYKDYQDFLQHVDAVIIASHPHSHYEQIKQALEHKKHVLCESPISLNYEDTKFLFEYAQKQHVILMDGIKTAYSTAYKRLLLLAQSGIIGKLVSIDSTCTSLDNSWNIDGTISSTSWNSICAWGPTALLPIFQLFGSHFNFLHLSSIYAQCNPSFDLFTKGDFQYAHSVASFKIGKGVKSEGELIISGTKGYIYVPAPWWITDYFEIRFENMSENKRYFYQLEGEGIRYMLLAFFNAIQGSQFNSPIQHETSCYISNIINDVINHNGEIIGQL